LGDVREIFHTPLKDQNNFSCVSGQATSTGSGLSARIEGKLSGKETSDGQENTIVGRSQQLAFASL
jgi:hypothetical protein